MNVLFDYYEKRETPALFLCTPYLEPIGSLGLGFNITNTIRYNALSELELDFPQSIDNGATIIDTYDKIQSKMVILVENVGYYIISECPEETKGNVAVKHITAQSLESEMMYKRLTALSSTTFKFYDYDSPAGTLMDFIISETTGWTIGYLDPDLIDVYRTFEIKNMTLYNFITSDVEKAYSCIFEFNTLNKTISAYYIPNLGEATDVYLSFNNINQSVELKEYADEIATVLYCYGGDDNIDITRVNPLGTKAIYNFDYYKTSDWMSSDLENAITAWETKVDNNQTTYANYATSLNTYIDSQIETETELADQKIKLSAMQKQLAALFATPGHNHDPIAGSIVDLQHVISNQKVKIKRTEKKVSTVRDNENSVISNMRKITAQLKFTGKENWKSLIIDLADNANSIIPRINTLISTWGSIYYDGSEGFDAEQFYAYLDDIGKNFYNCSTKLSKLLLVAKSNYSNYWSLTRDDIIKANSYIIQIIQHLDNLYDLFFNLIPYTTVTNDISFCKSILENYSDIIYYEDNFTYDQFSKLITFFFENTYTNKTVVLSKKFTQKQIQRTIQSLYREGQEILRRVSQPRYEFSGDFINFLSLPEYQDFIDKIDMGKLVNIELGSGEVIQAALLEVEYTYDKPTSFNMTFSNRVKLNKSNFKFADLFVETTNEANGGGITGVTGGATYATSGLSNSRMINPNTGTTAFGSGNQQGSLLANENVEVTTPATQNTPTNPVDTNNATVSTDGYIAFGVTPPTVYGNNQGVWLGWENGAKMSLYSDDNNYMQWDGFKLLIQAQNFTLDENGNITATSASLSGRVSAGEGDIAGWIIEANQIYTGSESGSYTVSLNSSGSNPAFSAGSAVLDTAPFRVYPDGRLVATSASISGSITATSGTFGGWNLSASSLYAGSGNTYIALSSDGNPAIYAGSETPETAPFRVYASGCVVATDANITGSIIAVSGSIGEWIISSGCLVSSDGKIKVSANSVDNAFNANNLFVVKHDGSLSATSASISGSITALWGKIGGWELNSGNLSSTDSKIQLSSTGSYAFFADDKFSVDHDGDLRATSASITGTITATKGSIGNWEITSGNLSSSNGAIQLSSTGSYAFYANDTFAVTNTGILTATNATISGSITASSGSIGGWKVTSGCIISTDNTVGMNSIATSADDIRFWAGDANPANAEFQVTEGGALFATSGSIGGNRLGSNYISSSLFTSGLLGKGWRITNDGEAEFQNITARGIIRTSVFEKDTISAINGIVLISKADVLVKDMTTSGSTFEISGSTTFSQNEIVRIKDGFDDEWMLVTSASPDNTYSIIRDISNNYTVSPCPVWKTGTAIVSMGVGTGTKTGFVLLDSSSASSPYIDVYGRNSNAYADYTLHGRYGYLAGIEDSDVGLHLADKWGLYTDNAYLKGSIVASSGSIGGWKITSGSLIGSSGATTVGLSTTGGTRPAIYAGSDTPTSAPFRVYQNGDVVATSASITGTITATKGAIGGWVVTSNCIVSTSGCVGMSSIDDVNDIRFWSGSTKPETAPFRVNENGLLIATSASISGSITATGGVFGGWNLSASSLYSGTANTYIGLASNGNPAIYAGSETQSTAPFRVYGSGCVVATSASISGSVTALWGKIGSWLLDSGNLSSTDNAVQLSSTGSYAFYANDKFSVNHNGDLIASSASISGNITALSGSVGGWTINSDSISSSGIRIGSGTSPEIEIGATDYLTGEGIWMGRRADGKYAISLGTSASYIAWSGSLLAMKNVSLDVDGASTHIAVGNPAPTSSTSGCGIWIDKTGFYSLKDSEQQVKISAEDGVLYAGNNSIGISASGILVNTINDAIFFYNNYNTRIGSIYSNAEYSSGSNVSSHIIGLYSGDTSENLVTNGTFTSGCSGWTFDESSSTTSEFRWDSNEKCITYGTLGVTTVGNLSGSSDNIDALPNMQYNISFLGKLYILVNSHDLGSLTVVLKEYDAGNNLLATNISGVLAKTYAWNGYDTGWVKYSLDFISNSNTDHFKIYIEHDESGIGSARTYYVDNIDLRLKTDNFSKIDLYKNKIEFVSASFVLNGNLQQTGISILNGSTSISGSLSVGGISSFIGATAISGSLYVGNKFQTTGSATIGTNLNVGTTLSVGGGTAINYLDYGSYTPTLTDDGNLEAYTARTTYFYRIHNRVTVFGRININPTSVAQTKFFMDLPVTASLSVAGELGGTAIAQGTTDQYSAIYGSSASNCAYWNYDATNTNAAEWSFHFSYVI